DRNAFVLGLLFGQADPGNLGVGVGDRRNHARIEKAFLPGDDFGGDVGLVHRLVRQHGLADDVADGVDVRHVGAHLLVDLDEATVGNLHAGLVGVNVLAVGRAAHRLQDKVVALGLGR